VQTSPLQLSPRPKRRRDGPLVTALRAGCVQKRPEPLMSQRLGPGWCCSTCTYCSSTEWQAQRRSRFLVIPRIENRGIDRAHKVQYNGPVRSQ
jgi:hypothetical protein